MAPYRRRKSMSPIERPTSSDSGATTAWTSRTAPAATPAAVAHEADHREMVALVLFDLGHRLVEERRIGEHRQLGEVVIESESLARGGGGLALGKEQTTDRHHVQRAERRDGQADPGDREDAEARAAGLLEHGAGHQH